jgi:colanic acid biosynthesis glycosyl transferase WcaI
MGRSTVGMKVIFVNRFFFPDISPTSQILSDLALHLDAGDDVHVITSRLRYDEPEARLPASERVGRTAVHRVWTSRFGRTNIVGVAIDYATFYMSATIELFRIASRGDIVVVMTDPPMISIPASAVARLKGARLVCWLQDIFPEVAWALDFKRFPRWIESGLAWLRDRSLVAASRVVALGDLMSARVAARGVARDRIRIIHNWAAGDAIRPIDPASNTLRRAWGLDGRFVVGYSGNMGRAHDFSSLLSAAERLKEKPRIVFLLIGAGNRRQAIEADVRARGLTNVMFQPYQPREALAQSLTAPDCHIVSLRPALEGLIVPSKIYSSLATGRPVIFIGAVDGEVARIMTLTEPVGFRVAPDDVESLVGAIERLAGHADEAAAIGRNARQLFEDLFDRLLALRKWTALIEELRP